MFSDNVFHINTEDIELQIDMNDLEINVFATGWLKEGNVLGRPVDIITNDDGSLFVSDDNAGEVYGVYYEK